MNIGYNFVKNKLGEVFKTATDTLVNTCHDLTLGTFNTDLSQTNNIQTSKYCNKKNKTIFLLIGVISLLVFLRIQLVNEPFETDEGVYGYIANRILDGQTPYKDIFDHKPPAIYYTYALIFHFFGTSTQAIKLFAIFWGVLSLISLFFLARKLYGKRVALFSAFLFALFSGGPLIQGTSANTEPFLILFTITSTYLLLIGLEKKSYYFFLSGLMIGIGFLFKQIAILHLLALTFYIFVIKITKNKKSLVNILIYLTSGFLLPLLIMAIFFAYKNSLKEALNDILLFNVYYSAQGFNYPLMHFLFSFYAQMGKVILNENLPLILLFFVGTIAIFKIFRLTNILMMYWLFFASLAITMGGIRFFPHYFIILIPPFALLAGYGINYIFEELKYPKMSIKKTTLCFLSVIIIISIIKVGIFQFNLYFFYSTEKISEIKYPSLNFALIKDLSDKIKKDIQKNDFIYASEANPLFYFYTQTVAPTKCIYEIDFINLKCGLYDEYKNNIKQISNLKPKFIIIHHSDSFVINRMVFRNIIDTLYEKYDDSTAYTIYKLK